MQIEKTPLTVKLKAVPSVAPVAPQQGRDATRSRRAAAGSACLIHDVYWGRFAARDSNSPAVFTKHRRCFQIDRRARLNVSQISGDFGKNSLPCQIRFHNATGPVPSQCLRSFTTSTGCGTTLTYSRALLLAPSKKIMSDARTSRLSRLQHPVKRPSTDHRWAIYRELVEPTVNLRNGD